MRFAAALDQAMAIKDRMDGAFGRNPNIAVESPDQQFPDLARSPVRLLGLETDNQALDHFRLVNWTNVSLRTNILLPLEIYISGWQLSPLAGLVCGGRLDKVSLTSLLGGRFRSDSLRLEWS